MCRSTRDRTQRAKRLAAVALAVVLTGVLAACGGGSSKPPVTAESSVGSAQPAATAANGAAAPVAPPAKSGSATDACGLITPQEATAALGVDSGPPQATTAGIEQACGYRPAGGQKLVVRIFHHDQAKAQFDAAKADTQRTTKIFQEVSGTGDHAYLVSNDDTWNGSGTISILKGSNYIDIALDVPGGGALVDALTTLGKGAAGRL